MSKRVAGFISRSSTSFMTCYRDECLNNQRTDSAAALKNDICELLSYTDVRFKTLI